MSTNMELITSVTVGSGGAASVTLPTSGIIPQTYTDLKIVVSARNSYDSTGLQITFNGTTSGYTMKRLYGTGSGNLNADSGPASTYISNTTVNDSTFTANNFGNGEIYIPNYAITGVAKSASVDGVTENRATTALSMLTTGLSSVTDAITTIGLVAVGGNFVEGSTFYLYGISNDISSPKATGGMVSQDNTYWYHTFATSAIFTPTETITCDYLVVAGGGGGGGANGNYGGGGGAGGLRSTVGATGGGGTLESAISLTANNPYAIVVGAGGAASVVPTSGGNSSITGSGLTTITSNGGGSGGSSPNGSTGVAQSGGSGGGGDGYTSTSGASGTANQGYAGGNGYIPGSGSRAGGGGGGANTVGTNAVGSQGGKGGDGVSIPAIANATFTGVNTYYAGGGGGASQTAGGTTGFGGLGGLGGGGNGTVDSNATSPITNTGSGGGAAGYNNNSNVAGNPTNGASGLVILRYAK